MKIKTDMEAKKEIPTGNDIDTKQTIDSTDNSETDQERRHGPYQSKSSKAPDGTWRR